MNEQPLRSRRWTKAESPRYWWHRLPGMDYVPPVYGELTDEEWRVLEEWYGATDGSQMIGECAVPLISLLHGFIMGNRVERIVQLGTCAGYSALLLGWMLRRLAAEHALFSLDIDEQMCAISRRWIGRAGLSDVVEIARGDSTAAESVVVARHYLGVPPDLILIDSSHQYHDTAAELALWYPALASGGLIVLHDVSAFAAGFDVTGAGGVRRAFEEWRRKTPGCESILLNGEASSMEGPRAFYKDACGVALLHKPGLPATG